MDLCKEVAGHDISGWKMRSCASVFAGQREFQGDVGLKLGGTFVLAIRFVAPLANGIGGGRGQERVSTKGSNRGDGAILRNQDFEENFTRAMGGQSIGGILGLDALAETALG